MVCAGAAGAACDNIGTVVPVSTTNVTSINSEASGAIIITYAPAVLPAATSILTMTPVTSAGAAFDMNLAANAGAAFAWKCGLATAGGQATTVLPKYLPGTCR